MKILKKTVQKDFIILNLTDPQLSDEEWTGEDQKNRILLENTVKTLVERVRPDLITVSGDLAWAEHYTAYKMFGDFMESFQIPWAPVWGNHDEQRGPEPVHQVEEMYLKYKYCLYEQGDPSLGYGNYVIGIEEEGQIVEALFMMDTHNRMPYTDEQGETKDAWAKLMPEQLSWYREQVMQLKEIGCTDSAVIVHIPIYAYREAFKEAWNENIGKRDVTVEDSYGENCWKEGYKSSYGVCYENIASYPEDEGMFDLICSLGSTKTVVCGHDHVNNTVINYKGVSLVYALKTGAGCYWTEALNGGTVLTVKKGGGISIRHEYVTV